MKKKKKIDRAAVTEGLKKLDELAAAHPELTSSESQERLGAYLKTLEDDDDDAAETNERG